MSEQPRDASTERFLANNAAELETQERHGLVPQSAIEDGSVRARKEAQERGWTVETTDGERVTVIKKTATAAGDVLEDADGNRYLAVTSRTTVERIDT